MSGARPSGSPASLRRRAQILDAARDVIAERGVVKLVIADVAARAEVSVATIYNLVGTRDRLLIALLDDIADRVRLQVDTTAVAPGFARCTSVVDAACCAVLDDPVTVRAVLSSVGADAPDQWLDRGLEGVIRERVVGAITTGHLVGGTAAQVAHHVQLGFRGALMSWVFGLIDDDALRPDAEAMALHVLANAAVAAERQKILIRLSELSAISPATFSAPRTEKDIS